MKGQVEQILKMKNRAETEEERRKNKKHTLVKIRELKKVKYIIKAKEPNRQSKSQE